jgi:hypothetical protein
MNDKEYLIAIVLAVISISISLIIAIDHDDGSIFQQKPIFAQTSSSTSSSSSSSSSAVHITKDTTNSYTISSGSSSVETFDTT